MKAFGGMGVDALQDVFEIRPGVDLVLAVQGNGPDGILGEIVIDRNTTIKKISLKLLPDPQGIPDRLTHFRLRQVCG